MSKNFYNLLREKNKLEKERDKALLKTLQSILNWETFGVLEEDKKIMEDLKVIQQHLELELASEVSDRAEFWNKKGK